MGYVRRYQLMNMSAELLNLNWHTYSDHLRDMMQNLMQSNVLSDVTLISEDKTRFKAHKFVLIACSPVFNSIIEDLPQIEGSVVYLRGILASELKSILQFMYLGQATLHQDRMNDFLNVAKSLEMKEISKDVKCETEDSSNAYVSADIGNTTKVEVNVYQGNFMEDENYIETKKSSSQNESKQFQCNKCCKQFAGSSGLT